MKRPTMSRWEAGLLLGIVVYAVVAYLPWTHETTLARVSVFAWMMFGLMIVAPLLGLIVALADKDGE
ncbi:hypothetical protein JL108_01280 [Aeromicrobium sp. YIM 150415]|uniref:hypothetical protein n=1 Tax=Aeromicrobium sp. YIM 150415 TaxID=2803912 RepID=UPI0019624104|nr:hypothetical protein [Aeromicrobium sp. YIM 150415]MBM9462058.1 hypothetical protein [Aeromicrobium sp. YIM 150415]